MQAENADSAGLTRSNLTSALNSLKFLVANVLRYAHAHVKHVKNRYHKGTLKWHAGLIKSLNITDAILSGFTVLLFKNAHHNMSTVT